MKPTFECLYRLENGTHIILEIKRTDLPNDADVSDIYKWLFIDKNGLSINQLWFCSTDSSGDVEERYFEQGYLKFDNAQGIFIEKFNSAQHQMVNNNNLQLPDDIMRAIVDYLE
ncbi:MAG: hypothetical protein V4594_19745 [Bacteroidota bacterium]